MKEAYLDEFFGPFILQALRKGNEYVNEKFSHLNITQD